MFMNLRPGDYFIRVIPPVAPPVYAQTTSGGDPDNNTNNDSNGELISGNIQSQPITLLSDLEINDGDADDDKNPSVDFGFYEPVGLGNYVFMDNDDSGTFNAGDMAIPGVTVQLYAEGANYGVATPLATKVTNPNGYYYFDNLKAGNYVVYIPGSNFNAGQPLRNKESVPGAQTGDTDDDDNGQDTKVNGGIRSNVVSLAPNTAPTNESGSGGINSGSPAYTGLLDDDNVNETIDFGFRVEKVALGNYVYMDNDDSGTFDGGDMALANVTVWLYAAGADYGVDRRAGHRCDRRERLLLLRPVERRSRTWCTSRRNELRRGPALVQQRIAPPGADTGDTVRQRRQRSGYARQRRYHVERD
jgi:hypothetical protein